MGSYSIEHMKRCFENKEWREENSPSENIALIELWLEHYKKEQEIIGLVEDYKKLLQKA